MATSPRVSCDACEFQWFGETVAHGLGILGRCPRCSGSLTFRDGEGGDAAHRDERVSDVSPAAVMGTPTSWAR